jgi:putative DNA primase/helicase
MNLRYDKKITISTGRSREEKRWKNKTLLWSDLLERLKKTHRTSETETDYHAAPKSRRDEIKDIGGFVGGNISGGRRKKGAVTFRTLVTLDVDYAKNDFDVWGLFKMLYDCAACVYSTHSHTEESPRLRIVLPLDREIDPEEYQPLARRIAGDLDIEIFDNTTFQPERLMYWPSTPSDGSYVFEYQDGQVLVADDVLNSYYDWKDSSQWPVSAKAKEAIKRGIKKQGDPLEKPGIVGAFNRAFTIETAIDEYLSDTYEKTDIPDRFTYLQGSTSAGLVVYDEVFAYSHHGSDPASERLCNAYDLVRLHLFGDLDEQVEEKTPINKRPSFIEMRELALKDKAVRKAVVKERIARAAEDFEDVQQGATDDHDETYAAGGVENNSDWLENLEVDKQGAIKSTIDNVVVILENDKRLKDVIAVDEFRNNYVKRRPFRWNKRDAYLFGNSDEAYIRRYLERKYGITGQNKIRDAIEIIANDNVFHPVRDYINSLQWDGERRIDTLLIDYMGAEDNEYVRAVTRKTLVAAVNRIFEPGCKFDYVCCLQGPQGIKKSTFWAVLGGQWYNKNFTFSMIGKKEAVEQLQGSWINEIGELDGLNRAEVNSVKNFIDITRDEMRPAYGRYKEEYLRQGIFVGSFNDETPLRDQTGGRRFWPVKVKGHQNWKEFVHSIGQIWAEAHTLYMGGETLYLDDELEAVANKVQEDFTEKDIRTGDLYRYLETKIPDNWQELDVWERREYLLQGNDAKPGDVLRDKITIMEIWQELFGGSVKDISKKDAREINEMMRDCKNWEPTRFGSNGSRERGYRRKVKNASLKAYNFTSN